MTIKKEKLKLAFGKGIPAVEEIMVEFTPGEFIKVWGRVPKKKKKK